MKIAQIRLTEYESTAWNWAKSAADDYWQDEDRDDGLHFEDSPVGIAAHGAAEILINDDVISDMIYRLTEQITEMSQAEGGYVIGRGWDDDAMSAKRFAAACRRIAAKLDELV